MSDHKDLKEFQKLRRKHKFEPHEWNSWIKLAKPKDIKTNYLWRFLSRPKKIKKKKGCLWIGIDPGVHGALGYFFTGYDEAAAKPWPSSGVVDFPEGVYETLREAASPGLQKHYNVIVAIEREWGFRQPGRIMGAKSMFNFGQLYGVVEGWTIALNLRYERIIPYVWKGDFGLSKDKKESLELARKFFPELMGFLCLVKDHNRCEALLIAKHLQLRAAYYFPELGKIDSNLALVDI